MLPQRRNCDIRKLAQLRRTHKVFTLTRTLEFLKGEPYHTHDDTYCGMLITDLASVQCRYGVYQILFVQATFHKSDNIY